MMQKSAYYINIVNFFLTICLNFILLLLSKIRGRPIKSKILILIGLKLIFVFVVVVGKKVQSYLLLKLIFF